MGNGNTMRSSTNGMIIKDVLVLYHMSNKLLWLSIDSTFTAQTSISVLGQLSALLLFVVGIVDALIVVSTIRECHYFFFNPTYWITPGFYKQVQIFCMQKSINYLQVVPFGPHSTK